MTQPHPPGATLTVPLSQGLIAVIDAARDAYEAASQAAGVMA